MKRPICAFLCYLCAFDPSPLAVGGGRFDEKLNLKFESVFLCNVLYRSWKVTIKRRFKGDYVQSIDGGLAFQANLDNYAMVRKYAQQ